MVVAPKYKHYDGINYAGETRVRMKDQEAIGTSGSTALFVTLMPGKCEVLAPAKGLWRGP